MLEKLKSLKLVFKIWNNWVFGKLDFQIESLREKVGKLDFLLEDFSQEEIKAQYRAYTYIWSLLRVKYYQLFQISKIKWLKQCDTISGLLHSSIKSRGKRNVISSLKDDDYLIEGVSRIQ